MKIEGTKIYGICLVRLQYQIKIAKSRIYKESLYDLERVILECYNTSEIDDIVDILELYDIEGEKLETVMEKLYKLAYSVSLLMKETIEFGFNEDGDLCLYLELKK